jgi:apolipoprotein N-acyltransferase
MPVTSRAHRFSFSSRRRESVGQHLGAFVVSGLLLMMAFPRPGWSVLAFVALVPAGIAAGRTREWRRLFWTAAVVYGLWWWWMLRWLNGVSPFGPIALGVWLGVNTALAVLAAGVLHQKLRWPMVVALPLGWVGIEVIRSVFPVGGLAWFSLAHSQAKWDVGDVGRVVQVADLFGQHTAGLVVAIVNGATVDLLLRRSVPRLSVGLAVLALGGALGYGQWRIGQYESVTRPGPAVGLVQTQREQDNRVQPSLEQIAEEWSDLVDLHQRAAEAVRALGGDAVIVWPETIVPAPLNPEGVARMAAVSRSPELSDDQRAWYGLKAQFGEVLPEVVRSGGLATIVGASAMVFEPEFRRYNAAYLLLADGRLQEQVYHKQHRVPVGEYIPGPRFIGSLVALLSPWESEYELAAGEGPVVFTLPGGWQAGTPICYEDAVAGICRRMVYAEGEKRLDVLINLTNDGWYPGRGMRRQHAQLASLRCIENRVPMARSVNTGISAAIDSLGRTTERLDEFKPGVLAAELRTDERETLYGRIGGWPWLLFVLFAGGATGFATVFGRPIAKHRIA